MRECQANRSFIYLFPFLNFVFPEGTSLSPFLTLFNKVLQILPSKYLWLLSLLLNVVSTFLCLLIHSSHPTY